MPTLNIRLFQTLTVSLDDQPPLDMGSPTTRMLFAYLVLNHRNRLDRRRLAFLFWPRGSEAAARRNLRQYLHRVRRALEPIDPNGRYLSTAGHNIQFNPPEDWFLDVAAFEQACAATNETLATAINLYTGELLPEFYDDWVIEERERLGRLYREALLRLVEQKEATKELPAAIEYARQYLIAEPLLETAYQRLMRLYYAAGDRGRVKQLFEQLTTTFQDELGSDPLPETAVMVQSMLAGEYSPHQTKAQHPSICLSRPPQP